MEQTHPSQAAQEEAPKTGCGFWIDRISAANLRHICRAGESKAMLGALCNATDAIEDAQALLKTLRSQQPVSGGDFEAWFATEYPDTSDRQGKFRMSPVRNLMRAAFDAGARPPSAPQAVGWRLVPDVPTPEMIEAICSEHAPGVWPSDYGPYAQEIRRADARRGYLEALDVAPPTQQGESNG